MKKIKNSYLEASIAETIEKATLLFSMNVPLILTSKEYNSGMLLNGHFWGRLSVIQATQTKVLVTHKGKTLHIDLLPYSRGKEIRRIRTALAEFFNYNPSVFYADSRYTK